MEGGSGSTSDSLPPVNIVPTLREALQKPNLDMTALHLKSEENNALKELREVSYQYMLLKVASTTHKGYSPSGHYMGMTYPGWFHFLGIGIA